MLSTLTIAQLEKLLDQFSVPMFVIETQGPGSNFCITCLNTALEELAGQPRNELLGRSILEIAATNAADDTIEYYQRCVATRQTIRFAFLFGNNNHRMHWNKTLQYARSPEGYDRVIATAIKVPDETPLLQDRLAFEDVRYFSSIADLQLENLSSAFDSATEQARVTQIEEDRIMRLHAVCRTIQSTVADIKDVVRAAQSRHSRAAKALQSSQDSSTLALNEFMETSSMDTVHAITAASGTSRVRSGP